MIVSSQFTLFVSESMYELQTRMTFEEGNMQAIRHEIVSTPKDSNEVLHIKLFVQPGGYMPEAIHDFRIGEFPNGIQRWELYIEVFDLNGKKNGEVRTAQEEGEAMPRPIGLGI
jgi:hypothetical protein